MKARLSRSICSKARRASRRATSCAPHKFLQPVRKPSQYCGEGFLFWRESCLGRASEFWRFVLHFWMFTVRILHSILLYVPPPPPHFPPPYYFKVLTPNDLIALALSSIFGLT